MTTLADLIQGHRPLAHHAAPGIPTAKVATVATDHGKTANRSNCSTFRRETSPADRPATPPPPAPPWTPDDIPRRRWFVRDSEGSCWSVSCTPAVTHAQIAASRPGAYIEPEPEEVEEPELPIPNPM